MTVAHAYARVGFGPKTVCCLQESKRESASAFPLIFPMPVQNEFCDVHYHLHIGAPNKVHIVGVGPRGLQCGRRIRAGV